MKIVTTQHETRELVNSTRADVTELKDLVFLLLASKLDSEQITTLTSSDPGLAARLMEAGQKVCPEILLHALNCTKTPVNG